MTTTPAIPAGRVPDVAGQLPGRVITRPLLVRFVSVGGALTVSLISPQRGWVRQGCFRRCWPPRGVAA